MKLNVFLIALAILSVTACKKDTITTAPPPIYTMEQGIYSGKYIEKTGSSATYYQFKVSVTLINDSTYSVQQIDAGNLPTFTMTRGAVISTGERTKLKFRIPRQDANGNNVVGDARITNGYDAIWSALERSFTFGIVFDNDPLNYIRYTGIKD
jgi:hypothetical protein